MQRHHVVVLASVLASVAVGCSTRARPVTATTETTGAATWTPESRLQEENARLLKERDDAQAALLDEREDHTRDLERFNADYAAQRERDELEMRALEALTVADVQAEALRKKAKTAPARTRRAIEDALADAQEEKARLHAQLKRLHAAASTGLDALRSDIESTMVNLDRALQITRTPADQKTKAKQVGPQKKPANPAE